MKICLAVHFAFVAMGCASAPPPARPPPAPPPERAACPLGVDGARVTTEDTAAGIALVVTSADDVAEVRERAFHAAKLHGPFGRLGKGHEGRHGLGGSHGLLAFALPPARAVAIEVEGGARIEITPLHTSDRSTLRTQVRERADKITRTPCDV